MTADPTAQFRARVRDFAAPAIASLPVADQRSAGELLTQERAWLACLAAAGLAAPHWSPEWGGGLSLAEQVVMHEELTRAGAPVTTFSFVGMNHTYATMMAAGTDEQRRRYLPPILRGAQIWCQGFSEPDAGSDLAALRTRAMREGEEYVINGQKIWSSGAEHADLCLLLVRTDHDAPKRKGITFLVLDMHSPGVEVRPIRQPDGRSHFCEIFLDDVRVPVSQRIGAENDGWRIAQATLSAERGPAVLEFAERTSAAMDRLIALARVHHIDGRPAIDDHAIRDRLMDLKIEVDVFADLCSKVVTDIVNQGGAGPEGSIIKIVYSELCQRVMAFGVELAPLSEHEYLDAGVAADESGNWVLDYVSSWIWMIGGGTNEIQRSVIGERILGLPREPQSA